MKREEGGKRERRWKETKDEEDKKGAGASKKESEAVITIYCPFLARLTESRFPHSSSCLELGCLSCCQLGLCEVDYCVSLVRFFSC